MFGRSKRRQADELRAKLVANAAQVKAWATDQEWPEIAWPAVGRLPIPWIVSPEQEQAWIERHAPGAANYDWFLEARPLTDGIESVTAMWMFGTGHEFDELKIRTITVPDPEYLAGALARCLHAAGLRGWTADDTQGTAEWLYEATASCTPGQFLSGKERCGFTLLHVVCSASRPGRLGVELRATPTTTALDGRPLDDDGHAAAP